jgi:hypothetical protein
MFRRMTLATAAVAVCGQGPEHILDVLIAKRPFA